MKKLFWDTKELDLRAKNGLGFDEEILIENAARSIANLVRKKIKKGKCIIGVCGSGNNGADVVCALRILSGDYKCAMFLASKKQNSILLKQIALAQKCGVKILDDFSQFNNAKCVIDGIFGIGLNRALDNETIELINFLNNLNCLKIACDVPSGLDRHGVGQGAVFKADFCVTMGVAKVSLYSDFAKDFVGKIKIGNLGMNCKFYEQESEIFKLCKSDLKLPFRIKQNINKGDFGHVFVLSGKMSGAANLCAMAALNIGAGLVSVVGDNLYLEPVLIKSSKISQKMKFGAVGMGLGELENSQKADLFEILKSKKGLVLDADLCYEPLAIELLKSNENMVITPHPKEFASLLKLAGLGEFDVEYVQKNRFDLAKIWSEKFLNVLVLKGANTLIAKKGKIYVMPYGSASLAKGGSGDVLSGVIIGLLAQGYSALDAAINGALAHALAIKSSKKNNYAINAKDIIKGLKWLKK